MPLQVAHLQRAVAGEGVARHEPLDSPPDGGAVRVSVRPGALRVLTVPAR